MGAAASSHHHPTTQERSADVNPQLYELLRALNGYVVIGTIANSSGEVVGIPVEEYHAAANHGAQDDTDNGSFDYIWRVEGLSSYREDENFRSQFKAKGLEWELSCSCDETSVSVRLHRLRDVPCGQPESDAEVRLTYVITLFNQSDGRQDWPRSAINAFADRDGKWGFKDFIASDTFMDPSNGFLIDGSCTLGIKLLRVSFFRVKKESLLVHRRHVNHDHTWAVRNFSTIERHCFRREEFDAAGCRWSIYLHRNHFGSRNHNDVMLFLSLDSTTGLKKSLTVSYQFHVKGLAGGYEFCDAYTNVFVAGQSHGHFLRMPGYVYDESGWSFEEDTCIVRVRLTLLGYAQAKTNDNRC